MNRLRTLSLIFILSILHNANGKDYFQYHSLIHELDNYILTENYEAALPLLDSIYVNYNFIYVRHCIKALQICLKTRDEQRSALWLKKSILGGVPKWYLWQLTSIRPIHYLSSCREHLNNFDSLHAIYLKRINRKLADYIDSLLEIDQFRTNRVNDGFLPLRYTVYGVQWLRNNNKQWKLIQQVMTTYGFPGEQLIGLPKIFEDTSVMFRNNVYRFSQLDAYQTYIMLIHCYSKKTSSLNEQLLQAVKTGMMPAYQYASINDFMSEYGYKKYNNNYYNQWHHDPDSTHLSEINIRRRSIGLNSFEDKQRNENANFTRRRAKTYYEEVFLE